MKVINFDKAIGECRAELKEKRNRANDATLGMRKIRNEVKQNIGHAESICDALANYDFKFARFAFSRAGHAVTQYLTQDIKDALASDFMIK